MNPKRLALGVESNGQSIVLKLAAPICSAVLAEQQNKRLLTPTALGVYLGRVTTPQRIWSHQC
jgi:hypothetical protein